MLIALHGGIHIWKDALCYVDWQSTAEELLSLDVSPRKFKMFKMSQQAKPSIKKKNLVLYQKVLEQNLLLTQHKRCLNLIQLMKLHLGALQLGETAFREFLKSIVAQLCVSYRGDRVSRLPERWR